MFEVLNLTEKNLIAIRINGEVKKVDYDMITPLIDGRVKDYGKIKMYIEIESIDGIKPSAFKEDLKTYIRHFNHIEKIAVVGRSKWEKLWSNLASPFVSGQIKYYDHAEVSDAVKWILE
ncbi:STAS/SEC14 domain-containing protein [uncultured Sunxiuqinia sp.]|uniref:STAS/SEC14 domain-containing protein n=1 Tax=uncultured Sunxiuqinia sp. TaxID=1573825 RepID=UPI002AA62201|nr:STAS/SEC14 domain-containing protein [uncultured Sunxiuqinia sp.]